jgi:hypothetical protein
MILASAGPTGVRPVRCDKERSDDKRSTAGPFFDTDVAAGCGTSLATPSVASAAVAFIDMMKNYRGSNSVDDPGYLYAWMLNAGDRGQAGTSTKKTALFDHRMGAGRTNVRFVGNPGLDTPWWWYQYELCVDDATTVTLTLNGGSALSSDADSIRATAWWYDRRIEAGTQIDDIDLRLKKTDGTLLISSLSAYDNKERVYYGSPGSKALKLEVVGTDVTSDGEGCGTNSMRVWVTILIEDDDRDDGDGPDFDPFTCEGVDVL